MTTEQKIKLEQAAESANGYNVYAIDTKGVAFNDGFKSGAQTILHNPEEWGLQDIEDSDERWCEVVDSFKQERDHYRRALEGLERITAGNPDYEFINYKAKEALKQQDDER